MPKSASSCLSNPKRYSDSSRSCWLPAPWSFDGDVRAPSTVAQVYSGRRPLSARVLGVSAKAREPGTVQLQPCQQGLPAGAGQQAQHRLEGLKVGLTHSSCCLAPSLPSMSKCQSIECIACAYAGPQTGSKSDLCNNVTCPLSAGVAEADRPIISVARHVTARCVGTHNKFQPSLRSQSWMRFAC